LIDKDAKNIILRVINVIIASISLIVN